ncbi:MAG: sulfatase modifying factor 1 [Flavobacteriales bacterium]|jgi:sulfatase modifying factor 1
MKKLLLLYCLTIGFASIAQKGQLVGIDDLMELPDFESKKISKELRPYVNQMKYIEAGNYHMGFENDEFISGGKQATVYGFYLSATEVPNWQYREFCQVMIDSMGIDSAHLFVPDTLCWLEGSNYSDGSVFLSENYFRHTAFDNYPVVGVSQIQSQLFCKWLTGKVKTRLEESSKTETWSKDFNIDLPSEAEWEFAARGGLDRLDYPWGNHIFGKDKNGNIVFKANCGAVRDTNKILVFQADFDGHLYTNEIDQYESNEYGLYNMSGNVSEWTRDEFSFNIYSFTQDINFSHINKAPSDSTRMVVKGGSFDDLPYFLKSGVRRDVNANTQSKNIGFRVALYYDGGRDSSIDLK